MRMDSKLRPYAIGLAVIGLFTFVLLVMVLTMGSLAAKDAKTDKAAQSIADKLNSYVTEKNKIPDNLQDVGAQNVPDTITYKKLSEQSYKFCITYRTKSSGFDATEALSEVASAEGAGSGDSSDYSGTHDDYYLIIPTSHKKGQTCQTINSFSYGGISNDPFTSDTSGSGSLFDSLGDSQSAARDTKRKTDINALESQLEAYYAQSGTYPTLAQVNDSSWRATNMPGFDSDALKDPSGTSAQLVSSPAKNAYSYQPVSDSGGACDGAANACQDYTLTAELEDGQPYTKTSLFSGSSTTNFD